MFPRFLSGSSYVLALTLGALLAACASEVLLGARNAEVEGVSTPVLDPCGDGLILTGSTPDGSCFCLVGETKPCARVMPSFGPRVPGCLNGVQECQSRVFEFDLWGECMVTPVAEVCDGAQDENCDGLVDEGCPCTAPSQRPCGFENGFGNCRAGIQQCLGDGTWSTECEGAVFYLPEECGDGIDNDCDGSIDEGCDCLSFPEECGDGVDNDCDGVVDEPQCISPDGGVACPTNPPLASCTQGSGGIGPYISMRGADTTATSDELAGSCGGAGANESRIFQTVQPGIYSFTTAGSTYDTILYLLEGSCDGPELICNDNAGGSITAAFTYAFPEPAEIIVVIDGASGQCGQALLTVLQIGTF